MKLLRTALVLGTGYVLGARAGRERYEQIMAGANKLWESSPFKQGREKAKDAAASTFEQAKQAATEKAKEAAHAVKTKVANGGDALDDSVIVVEPIDG
ncbi:MAG: YtxH domain-containing protein [Actinomycetaceae bacterium]|nr:YtxH domain-containing protein [Actinomycetaceae bacterium]MDY5854698.1 YtxH domain-containing protein [Arcanobacterium sp.]